MNVRLAMTATVTLATAGFIYASGAFQEEGAPESPAPGSHHELLASEVGTWDASMEMEGAPPSEGFTEVVTMIHGGLWQMAQFEGEFMGSPFSGHSCTGYDPETQKYVGTWVDSMTTRITMMEGTSSEDGKVRTMIFEGPNQMGATVKHRHVAEQPDPNTRILSMYETGEDGTEALTMKINYKRKDS